MCMVFTNHMLCLDDLKIELDTLFALHNDLPLVEIN